jgi:transcriptional regulator GlxA family with amidase domain
MIAGMRIVAVVFPDVQSLDVTGPTEVFSIAQRLGHAPYEIELVASSAAPVRASSGLRLVPDRAVGACRGPIDTLVVAGGLGTVAARRDEQLVAWLREAAGRSRRVTSVCTGAFLLAKAGLLDGRRATTHWDHCAALRRNHPEVTVEPDSIFVRDTRSGTGGDVYTSAGVTAGIDLALALVEEDAGRGAALEVARQLVVFVQRPGGQAQFSAQLAHPPARRPTLRELQAWLPDHLDEDLTVETLAERAFMSPRNFARAFRREVGVTPAAYVTSLRVERARLELEAGDAPVEVVARRCGFGTVETMRRSFQRRLYTSPAEYRDRFRVPTGRGA